VSTALLALILCTPLFWEGLARQLGSRGWNLGMAWGELADALRPRVLRHLFTRHAVLAAQEYAGNRFRYAALHLQCLKRMSTDPTALLTPAGISHPFTLDPRALESARALAAESLDQWGLDLVKEAEVVVADPEAIKILPAGLPRNFPGGVQVLEGFLNIGIPIVRVLRTALEWSNEWCHALYTIEQFERIQDVVARAGRFHDQLAAMCRPNEPLRPENRALSRHLLFRGFVERDAARRRADWEAALTWNPTNDNVRKLLDGD
jgi:hypothetical protein